MKASEIISNITKQIEHEKKAIDICEIRLDMLLTILHMAKKDGYIEKKKTESFEALEKRNRTDENLK